MRLPVDIDGSLGEGGGQVLRTSLALAIITKRKLRMKRIRAGRKKPGLQHQHLACVKAAVRLSNGRATAPGGAELAVNGQELEFIPGDGISPVIEIDIGTAGSTTLLIQTVLVPALVSGLEHKLIVVGGTHNPMAPPFEFLDRVFAPHLREMGANVTFTLERHGFLPKGGGRIVVDVKPSKLAPIDIVDAGEVVAKRAWAMVAGLPRHIAEREIACAHERLDKPETEIREFAKDGPHNLFMAEVELASGARELATSHGKKGYPAEDVADDALDEIEDFLDAAVPVGEHLADQLLLPMAIAGGGKFRTDDLSLHATTNMDTIKAFLDVDFEIHRGGDGVTVIVKSR
ncbi:MAG: RNA 3'-terminal phosphate cyclase [Kofleriaceae bacterium]